MPQNLRVTLLAMVNIFRRLRGAKAPSGVETPDLPRSDGMAYAPTDTGKITFINASLPDATPIYAALNREFFDGILPLCEIRWSRRLTRAAGNIRVQSRVISLSVPLLIDAFADGATHEVCGLAACDGETALGEILKHEMIHLWLHIKKLPCGHTPAFRAKAREIGQPKTRHGIALPPAKNGWIYRCGHCHAQIPRRRRMSRVGACAACCRSYNGGRFDARFVLKGHRVGK